MAPTPTIVIGIGEAGVRMLSRFQEVVESEQLDEDRYLLLGIDTKEGDIEKNFPALSEQNRHVLFQPKKRRWEQKTERFSYLEPGDEPADTGGVTRQRPLARAHIDDSENFPALEGFLETRIGNFVERTNEQETHVWLVNSLGGGTGSGAFPIMAAVLDRTIKRVKSQVDSDPGFEVGGIGSLPRLRNLSNWFPDASPRHIINSYMALRDLRALVEHEYERSALRIDVEAKEHEGVDTLQDPYIALEDRPFDKYFLLPAEQSEIDNVRQRRELNRMVADLIVYLSTSSGPEDYPDVGAKYDDAVLYTIDEAALEFPTELATRYVRTRARIAELTDEIDDLTDRRDAYSELRAYLQAVLDIRRGELPADDSAVEVRLVRAAASEADEVDLSLLSEDNVEAEAAAAAETVSKKVPTRVEAFADVEGVPLLAADDGIDGVALIGRFFFYDQLVERLDTIISQNNFENEVRNRYVDYKDDIRANVRQSTFEAMEQQDDAARLWSMDNGFEDYLVLRRNALTEEIESARLPGVTKRAEIDERDRIDDDLSALRTQKSSLDSHLRLRDAVNRLRDDAEERLERLRGEFESAVKEMDNDLAERKRERANERNTAASLTDDEHPSLVEFKPEQFAKLAVEEPENLTEESIEDVRDEWGFQDLVDKKVISRQRLTETITELLTNQLNERLADQSMTDPNAILAPLRHPKNDWLDAEIRDIRNANQNRVNVEHVIESGEIADPLSLRFLGTYTNLDLDETTEFGTVNRLYEKGERELVEKLTPGDEVDEIVEKYLRFAYPELGGAGRSTSPPADVAVDPEDE